MAGRRSKALLEAAGYRVTRAAASLGEWDLVGLGPHGVVVVQVRTRDWPGWTNGWRWRSPALGPT
jgi:hypothetical protein